MSVHRRRFDALVFDLDGSIVDTEQVVHQAWAELFALYGAAFTTSEWCAGVGTKGGFDPLAVLAERSTRPLADPDELVRQVAAREEELLAPLQARPGVLDWIATAEQHGLGLGVASSSPYDWVERRLRGLGLWDHFPVIVTPTSGLPAKPAPDVYLEACRQLEVEPDRALAVEDSPHGLTAARRAGLTCVVVPNSITAALDLSAADLRLESLADHQLAQLLTSTLGI